MLASELSEQIVAAIEAKEWTRAQRLINDERREQTGDGKRYCTLPEYPGAWGRFKDRGYPFSLRRDYDMASLNDIQTIEAILPFVEEWNMPGIGGADVVLNGAVRKAELLDDVDEMLIGWLIREFSLHRRELMRPRKN